MYHVEVVNRPYAGRIPEDEWTRVSSHRVARRAAQRLRRESKWRTDGNSWSGHTRCVDDGGHLYYDETDFYDGLHLVRIDLGGEVIERVF
jgi:hypothetical protein